MEIAVFNKDMSKGNYHLEVHKDVETRIMNYQPLPTNRKRRSRLYHVTTSKVLKNLVEILMEWVMLTLIMERRFNYNRYLRGRIYSTEVSDVEISSLDN